MNFPFIRIRNTKCQSLFPKTRIVSFIVFLVFPVSLCGCFSYSFVDKKGVRHVVGFVDMEIRPLPQASPANNAELVSITSFGLSIQSDIDQSNQAAFGYTRKLIVTLPENSCIDINQFGPCAARVEQSQQAEPENRP